MEQPIEDPKPLKSKRNWLQGRKESIICAVSRYNQAKRSIPYEWSDEYVSICIQIAQLDAKAAVKTWGQSEF